jgi:glycosyltransferase involved in cell wall biosynthesis
MRVLHICSGNLYGGVETIQVTLARYRDQCAEIEPHFTVCFNGRLSQELHALDVPVHNLGAVRVRNPISVLTARGRLRELLKLLRYDAAICHSAWTQSIFGPIVQGAGVPLLFWLHGATSGTHWLERWAKRTRPKRVICCSEFTSSLLWKLYPGVPREVVYAPVPPIVKPPSDSQRLATRRELNTPADAVVIVQVSRMEAWKGHRLHLEALAKVKDVPRWMCWFVGGAQRPMEARYLEELKRTAERYGIADRLRFLGHRTDVPRLVTAADLFCQPNTGPEPFGVVFVEALSAGLPVITTAMGGALEIVDSNCGVLTPRSDASALAAAIRRLVTTDELRAAMNNSARTRARELCEPSQQLKRLTDVIQTTIAQRNAA